jgi:hypothetical protein
MGVFWENSFCTGIPLPKKSISIITFISHLKLAFRRDKHFKQLIFLTFSHCYDGAEEDKEIKSFILDRVSFK